MGTNVHQFIAHSEVLEHKFTHAAAFLVRTIPSASQELIIAVTLLKIRAGCRNNFLLRNYCSISSECLFYQLFYSSSSDFGDAASRLMCVGQNGFRPCRDLWRRLQVGIGVGKPRHPGAGNYLMKGSRPRQSRLYNRRRHHRAIVS